VQERQQDHRQIWKGQFGGFGRLGKTLQGMFAVPCCIVPHIAAAVAHRIAFG
jgi:hypothetical protein